MSLSIQFTGLPRIGSAARLFATSHKLILLFLATLVCLSSSRTAGAQAEKAESPPALAIASIQVEPANPGPDTLCRLQIDLQNRGSEIASQLDFSVRINGQELAVYTNHLFMIPIPPDTTEPVELYNFWSTETSRPMPKDGKLQLDVTLEAARWMEIKDDKEGVEVWTPLGDVEGLPVSRSVTLSMSR